MLGSHGPGGASPTAILTGERTWPGFTRENYWYMRHVACYRWAARTIANTTSHEPILDAGSGEGYGAAVIAEELGRTVTAVELDAPTAAHARAHYPSITQIRANLIALPFRSRVFAASVSLQVVEHIWDPLTYLRELARCTSGLVIISTPNRCVHSPGLERGQRPDNPFHVREFDAPELVELLMEAMPHRTPTIYGVHHGERIRSWEESNGSLPSSLLESTVTSHASEFASTVRHDDFAIELLNDGEPGTEIHDLVALW